MHRTFDRGFAQPLLPFNFYRSITSHAVYRMRLADAPDAPCRIGERFQGAAEIFNRCVPAGRNECVVIEPGLTKARGMAFVQSQAMVKVEMSHGITCR